MNRASSPGESRTDPDGRRTLGPGLVTILDFSLALFGGVALVAGVRSPAQLGSVANIGAVAAALLCTRTTAGILARQRASRAESSYRRQCRETEQRLAQAHARLAAAAPFEVTGRVAAGIVHDVNNLLTVILGYLGDWRDSNRPAAELRDEIAEAERLAVQGGEIAGQLLGFLRHQSASSSQADVNDLLGGLKRIFERILGPGIDLTIRPGHSLWRTRVAPADLSRILVNLTLNARNAMPAGGRLEIETANAVCEGSMVGPLQAPPPGPYVMIGVTDSGVGMPESLLRELFQPLATTRAAGGGTGLGLSGSYAIVKAAGGYLTVRSEPGRGTRFEIYLPRVVDEDGRSAGEGASVLGSSSSAISG